MRRPRWILAAVVLAYGAPALADSEADRLFAEGKAALEANRYDEACDKLAKSQALDPATGTLLALALCHEAQGKTATAWSEFKRVAEASVRDGRADRLSLARSKVAALEPQLAHVVIAISNASPDTRVVCDATTLAPEDYNRPWPVDGGDHAIVISAPGKKPWSTSVSVHGAGTATIRVPPLEAEPGTAEARVEQPTPARPVPPQRIIAWSLIGAGAASFVVGTIFGVRAAVLADYSRSRCPASLCLDPIGVGENHDAQTSAWIADFAVPLGLAAAGAGVVLLLMKPHAAAGSTGGLRVTPIATGTATGVALCGSW